MLLDAFLSFAHFLFAFGVLGALAAEAWLLRLKVTPEIRALLLRVDMMYGFAAMAVILAGLARVFWGAKAASFYATEPFFWAKMAVFLAVGVVSIAPTLAFFRWRAAAKNNPSYAPDDAEVAKLRRLVRLELVVFMFIPLFAALMARGLGSS